LAPLRVAKIVSTLVLVRISLIEGISSKLPSTVLAPRLINSVNFNCFSASIMDSFLVNIKTLKAFLSKIDFVILLPNYKINKKKEEIKQHIHCD